MSRDAEQRIHELEFQLTHAQRLYDQLNEVVTAQASQIERLQSKMEQMQTQIERLKESLPESSDPLDEKPPHY